MKRLHIIFDRLPRDLVIALTLACILFVLAPRLDETPVRVLLGLLLVLFLPGYSLVAALFPRKGDLDGIERIALRFGLSIAVVPLIGLLLNYTPHEIRLVPVLLGLSVFTILLALVAYVRRGWFLRRSGLRSGLGFRAKIFKPEDQFNSGDGHANESDIQGRGFEATHEAGFERGRGG